MNKDIYVCVGNHDEASSNNNYPNCMIKTQKHYINKLKKYIDEITNDLETVRGSSQEAADSLQGTEGDYAKKMITDLLDRNSLPSIEQLEPLDDDTENSIKLYSDTKIGVYEDAYSSYIVIIINTNILSPDYLEAVRKKIEETRKKNCNQNKVIFVMGHIPLFYDKHKKEKVAKAKDADKAKDKGKAKEKAKDKAKDKDADKAKDKDKAGSPKKEQDITKIKKGTFGEDKSSELIDLLYDILVEYNCIYLCADCHNFNIMSIKKRGKSLIQITSGTGGADPDIIKDLKDKKDKKEDKISEYNIAYYSINSYGYCKIVVESGSGDSGGSGGSVVVSYNKIIAAEDDNKSIDELYIYSVKNNEIEYREPPLTGEEKNKVKNTIILNASNNKEYYCNRVAKYNTSKDINIKESNIIKSEDSDKGICYEKKGK